MKYLISYFYQIRFMTSNMLPVSTAAYDPKWFHKDNDNNYRYLDKNCVLNGYRMEKLVLSSRRYHNLERNKLDCVSICGNGKAIISDTCPFMIEYAEHLRETYPNFNDFLAECEKEVEELNSRFNFGIDTIVLIVHETPSRGCGERPVLQEWFRENGYELEEFNQ